MTILPPLVRWGRSVTSPPLLKGLVAYWNLDETSGQRNDSGPNALHLTDNNTVTSMTGVGGAGTAASFTAANIERLNCTSGIDPLQIGAGPRTFAGWLYVTDETYSRDFLALDGASRSFIVSIYPTEAVYGIRWSPAFNQNVTSIAFTAGAWNFWAWSWAGIGNVSTFRINANTEATAALTGPFATGSQFTLGGSGTGGTANSMQGGMQSFGVWNRVLTTAELNWLAGGGRRYADLAAYAGG